jgi:hypothetical protein
VSLWIGSFYSFQLLELSSGGPALDAPIAMDGLLAPYGWTIQASQKSWTTGYTQNSISVKWLNLFFFWKTICLTFPPSSSFPFFFCTATIDFFHFYYILTK